MTKSPHLHGLQESLQSQVLLEIQREGQMTRDVIETGPVQGIPNEQLRTFWKTHLGRSKLKVGPCPNPALRMFRVYRDRAPKWRIHS